MTSLGCTATADGATACAPSGCPGDVRITLGKHREARPGGKPNLPTGRPRLLGVELHDQLLGYLRIDLRTHRQRMDQDRQRLRDDLEPGRGRTIAEGRPRQLEGEGLLRLLADRDDVVLLDPVGRHVHPLAVDQEVSVRDELTRRAPGSGEASPVHDVVQPGFEDLKKRLAGLAGSGRGLRVVAAELLFHHAVGEAGLLLLLQLGQVFLLLRPRAAVLAGREGAALEGLVAADEVGLEATGLLGHGTGVASHYLASSPLRPDAAWAAGFRCGPAG